jgi:hypothetical protein
MYKEGEECGRGERDRLLAVRTIKFPCDQPGTVAPTRFAMFPWLSLVLGTCVLVAFVHATEWIAESVVVTYLLTVRAVADGGEGVGGGGVCRINTPRTHQARNNFSQVKSKVRTLDFCGYIADGRSG